MADLPFTAGDRAILNPWDTPTIRNGPELPSFALVLGPARAPRFSSATTREILGARRDEDMH